MREAITKALLAVYGLVNKTGLLEQAWCKNLFLRSYFGYKKYAEDPFAGLIKSRPALFEDGHILDIGANVGYTVSLFSKAADPGFKVYCFEPDTSNFALLKEVISRQSNRDRIVPTFAAVGATDGTIELWHNRAHHGDHRILTQRFRESGVETHRVSTVPLISVDSFARGEGIEGSIKFIKIDVQGYEYPVCQGMVQTLERNPELVIALEYAPETMKALGFEPYDLIEFFQQRNYYIYILAKDGTTKALTQEALARSLRGSDYFDILVSRRELSCETERAAKEAGVALSQSQHHFFSAYNIQWILASLTLIISIWLSSGTMAPYGATLFSPLVLEPCGYLANIDHPHHKAVFLMLDGADVSQWGFSVVLRRILFVWVAFPFMKLWGYESGGFVASLLIHVVSFILFIRFLRQKIGENAALFGMWILATYPGISYWAALPYAYAAIVPCCLLAVILLWELNSTTAITKAMAVSLLLGLLLTAYDLLFFALAALMIVVGKRRAKLIPVVLLGVLIPSIISNLLLKEIYGVSLSNSNTDIYFYIFRSYFHPEWDKWMPLLKEVPRVALNNYLFSNFLFLPLLFLVLYGINILTSRLELTLVEKSVIYSVVAIFLFNNLAPPYPKWQFRGAWVARVYQPIFPVLMLFSVRKLQQLWSLGKAAKIATIALFAATVVANASIAFGPVLNNPLASKLYYRFYWHSHSGASSPSAMTENLIKYGRRPLGFCSTRVV